MMESQQAPQGNHQERPDDANQPNSSPDERLPERAAETAAECSPGGTTDRDPRSEHAEPRRPVRRMGPAAGELTRRAALQAGSAMPRRLGPYGASLTRVYSSGTFLLDLRIHVGQQIRSGAIDFRSRATHRLASARDCSPHRDPGYGAASLNTVPKPLPPPWNVVPYNTPASSAIRSPHGNSPSLPA
jgi:hypothetical protein